MLDACPRVGRELLQAQHQVESILMFVLGVVLINTLASFMSILPSLFIFCITPSLFILLLPGTNCAIIIMFYINFKSVLLGYENRTG